MKTNINELRKIIRDVILECCEMDMAPAVSIDIEEEALEPIANVITDVFADDVESYPDSHLDDNGRMFDYGHQKSDSQEGRMSKAKLFRMGQMSQSLHDKLEDGDDLPGWVQDKITTAEDRLQSAYDYMSYKIQRMEKSGCSCNEATARKLARNYLRGIK